MNEHVFENLNQVHKYLIEEGWQITYNTLKKRVEVENLLKKNARAGGFRQRDVDAFAGQCLRLTPEAEASRAAASRPSPADPETSPGDAQRKIRAEADLKERQRQLLEFTLAEKRGEMCATAVIEAELAARLKAVALTFRSWGQEAANQVSALYGAEDRAALDLARAVAGDDQELFERLLERVPAIAAWHQGRAPDFVALHRDLVDSALDALATGAWFTEDMRQAWERHEKGLEA